MALHKDFPQSPHAIVDPGIRWFPADEALRTSDVDTPLGKIRFDEHGDAIGAGFSMYRVKDGVYTQRA